MDQSALVLPAFIVRLLVWGCNLFKIGVTYWKITTKKTSQLQLLRLHFKVKFSETWGVTLCLVWICQTCAFEPRISFTQNPRRYFVLVSSVHTHSGQRRHRESHVDPSNLKMTLKWNRTRGSLVVNLLKQTALLSFHYTKMSVCL